MGGWVCAAKTLGTYRSAPETTAAAALALTRFFCFPKHLSFVVFFYRCSMVSLKLPQKTLTAAVPAPFLSRPVDFTPQFPTLIRTSRGRLDCSARDAAPIPHFYQCHTHFRERGNIASQQSLETRRILNALNMPMRPDPSPTTSAQSANLKPHPPHWQVLAANDDKPRSRNRN